MSVTFSNLVDALDARQSREEFTACCPAHEDRHPSFSFTCRDGQLLMHCFAGCSFYDIVQALERRGLWPVEVEEGEHPTGHDNAGFPPGFLKFDAEIVSPKDGVVEAYLAKRGIDVGALHDIGYHPEAFHRPSGWPWPAMVAAVRDVDGHPRALHRTFLNYTGPPRKAPIDPVRMLWGPARGCAIHLAQAAPTLVIAEGIETTASAMKLLNLPGWSAISAGNLRHVELPEIVREVVIAADNDAVGERAAIAAARRFRREGRIARILKPVGCKDFNDLLLGKQL
jgi:hypothetical protein